MCRRICPRDSRARRKTIGREHERKSTWSRFPDLVVMRNNLLIRYSKQRTGKRWNSVPYARNTIVHFIAVYRPPKQLIATVHIMPWHIRGPQHLQNTHKFQAHTGFSPGLSVRTSLRAFTISRDSKLSLKITTPSVLRRTHPYKTWSGIATFANDWAAPGCRRLLQANFIHWECLLCSQMRRSCMMRRSALFPLLIGNPRWAELFIRLFFFAKTSQGVKSYLDIYPVGYMGKIYTTQFAAPEVIGASENESDDWREFGPLRVFKCLDINKNWTAARAGVVSRRCTLIQMYSNIMPASRQLLRLYCTLYGVHRIL